MVAKDGWGEVVVNGEVGIGDNENGEEGVV